MATLPIVGTLPANSVEEDIFYAILQLNLTILFMNSRTVTLPIDCVSV